MLLPITLLPPDIVVAKTEFLEIYNNIENQPHTRNIIDNMYFIDNIIVRVWPGIMITFTDSEITESDKSDKPTPKTKIG